MRFLDIYFDDEDMDLNQCVDKFNLMCDMGFYPQILEFTHYDLAKNAPDLPDTNLWKKFLLNKKIKEWYSSERAIQLDAQIQKLIRTAASSGSTATVQTLNALLSQQRQLQEQSNDNKTLIIYNFIPITDEERKNPNINVVQNIPTGVRRAITYVNGSTNKNKKN